MDDPRHLLRRAGEMAAQLIDKTTPEQLGLPTPCSEWDVRALINHITSGNLRFIGVLGGPPGPAPGEDVLGDDPAAAFRSSFTKLAAAFDEDGVLERTVQTPLGEGPGVLLLTIRITELTTHSWDIAVATGQPRDLDPALIEFAAAALRASNLPRGEGGPFGPEQPVPDDAPAADRLAALAGRTLPPPE
jgi:uncharacterized protein (TIGR03086 family)